MEVFGFPALSSGFIEREIGGTNRANHAGLEQDSEPPVTPGSELWLKVLIAARVVPEHRSQLEDLLRVPAAAAAADAPGGLVVVVSGDLLFIRHT